MGTSNEFYLILNLYIICSSSQFGTVHTALINIFSYESHNENGRSAEINISQCTNLPEEMVNDVRSINTHSQCVRLYDEFDCKGESIEVMPNSPSHDNLYFWNFEDKADSVGPCRDPCDPEVTGTLPDEPFEIEIFAVAEFKGDSETMLIDGCTPIPKRFANRTMSVKPYGHCIQIYVNTECIHDSVGFDWKSIELRGGTPFHWNLYHWVFEDYQAISHCSYKCNVTLNNAATSVITPLASHGEVILFKKKNFTGKWLKYDFKYEECINFNFKWTKNPGSISVGNETCVKLYERRNCEGISYTLTLSQLDLSSDEFGTAMRSMGVCEHKEGEEEEEDEEEDEEENEEKEEKKNVEESSTTSLRHTEYGQSVNVHSHILDTREPEQSTREPEKSTREPEKSTREPEKSTREPEKSTREPGNDTRESEKSTRKPDHDSLHSDAQTLSVGVFFTMYLLCFVCNYAGYML